MLRYVPKAVINKHISKLLINCFEGRRAVRMHIAITKIITARTNVATYAKYLLISKKIDLKIVLSLKKARVSCVIANILKKAGNNRAIAR
jgi:hypothetical protein